MNPEPRTLNSEQVSASAEARKTGERVYDLEERLLNFAVAVIDVSERLPKTRAGNHIAGQFLRSGTSPFGNHGEAQAPESQEDFIHKLKICLEELRETRRWARLIERMAWLRGDAQLAFVLREGEELIRFFKASVQTAEGTLHSRKGAAAASQNARATS